MASNPTNLTNDELLTQYAIAVARLHHSSEEDPDSDDLHLECHRLQQIGALHGHSVSSLMDRIMNNITEE